VEEMVKLERDRERVNGWKRRRKGERLKERKEDRDRKGANGWKRRGKGERLKE
jgi:hypothetical protein